MDLLEYLTKSEGVLLLDGGMGTQLDARGAEMGGEANVTDAGKAQEELAKLGVQPAVS